MTSFAKGQILLRDEFAKDKFAKGQILLRENPCLMLFFFVLSAVLSVKVENNIKSTTSP